MVTKILSMVLMLVLATNVLTQGIESKETSSRVKIKNIDGKHHFFINDELFLLKGAGGSGNLGLLAKAGGNSIRTWSTRNGQEILDTAQKYNLMVAMGVSMGQELHGFDYTNSETVEAQFQRIIKEIERYKNHPNLLCWVVGNELNLSPRRGSAVNPRVYDALKDIVDYIHKEDPNHPVTTTFAGVSKEHIKVALERCPDLDFISLQVYGGLGKIPEMAREAEIKIPYVITEYGPVGHWEMPRTEWGREIEECSSAKATGLFNRIQQGIINDPSGMNLGGYAFLWGQKQERTPTWYGMFLKTGESTEVVDELTRYWTGSYPAIRSPKVEGIKLNGKNAVDNIYVKADEKCTVKVDASDPGNFSLEYKWYITKEVINRSQGGAREIEPENVIFEILSDNKGIMEFAAPSEAGEYRLFSYVFNGIGKAGTANIPFKVE